LFIAAGNGHVLAFDNLSGLPPWLSDAFCRLTSGGAFSTRRLFTDQDEILFAATRPIIVNGIEEIITRPDLADRAILLMLAPIAERQRRPETALWREFELARPHILGALLDAVVHGLRMLPHVRLRSCRVWLISRSGPQPARVHFDPWARLKPLMTITGAKRSRTSSTPTQWRLTRSWPTARNGGEAQPTFCSSASMSAEMPWPLGQGLAGRRILAHSQAGCAGPRPRFARLGLRSSSAARGGRERGPSG
jgi:hypothetical protein